MLNLTPVLTTFAVVGVPCITITIIVKMTHNHDERLAQIKADADAQPKDRRIL